MRWARNATNVFVYLLVLASQAYSAGISIQRYVIPTYPAAANRARIQGSFVVSLELSKGHVEKITIVSHTIFGLGNREIEGPPPADFASCIHDSVSKWEFNQADPFEKRTVTSTVEFRLADTTSTADAELHTFRVQEKGNLPWKIRIEANRLGSDQEQKSKY